MLRHLDVGIHIVVTEVPGLVCADWLTASWADRRLTALDPASRLLPQTTMGDAIALSLDAFLYQPLPSFVMALQFAPFRSTSAICRDRDLSLQNRRETRSIAPKSGEKGKLGVHGAARAKKNNLQNARSVLWIPIRQAR